MKCFPGSPMLAFAKALRTNFRLANPRPTLVNWEWNKYGAWFYSKFGWTIQAGWIVYRGVSVYSMKRRMCFRLVSVRSRTVQQRVGAKPSVLASSCSKNVANNSSIGVWWSKWWSAKFNHISCKFCVNLTKSVCTSSGEINIFGPVVVSLCTNMFVLEQKMKNTRDSSHLRQGAHCSDCVCKRFALFAQIVSNSWSSTVRSKDLTASRTAPHRVLRRRAIFSLSEYAALVSLKLFWTKCTRKCYLKSSF